MKGFDVATAADGESAVDLAQAFQPHLLILDIRLPGMDGVETFTAIRQHLPTVPALFMTAYAASGRARAANDLGALSVFSKPLNIACLVDTACSNTGPAPVLVVDDDQPLLKSLSRALTSTGLSVATATTFQEAAQLIRQRPDRIVIADVFLHDGFGYELLEVMANPTNKHPIVLVTGQNEWLSQPPPPHLAAAHLSCLPKPLDVDCLVDRIKVLQRSG